MKRSYTTKRRNRYAELLRAKYLARDLVKVRVIMSPECLCDADADKHEALAAYDEAVQRGVDGERAEEAAEAAWNEENQC